MYCYAELEKINQLLFVFFEKTFITLVHIVRTNEDDFN